MRALAVSIIVAIAVVALAYAAYTQAYPTYSYRYRITIEVDTTDGMKTGSSVLETRTIQFPRWVTLGNNDYQTTTRGEAVFVDLGSGRHIVALLALGDHAEYAAHRFFAPRSFLGISWGSTDDVKWSKQFSTMTGRAKFAGDANPTLITFGNLADPASVKSVPFGNPQATFGPNIGAVRAWIDLTKDGVTEGISQRLPWLGDREARMTAFKIIRAGHLGGGASPLWIFKREHGDH
jgi:hypothetical protein